MDIQRRHEKGVILEMQLYVYVTYWKLLHWFPFLSGPKVFQRTPCGLAVEPSYIEGIRVVIVLFGTEALRAPKDETALDESLNTRITERKHSC